MILSKTIKHSFLGIILSGLLASTPFAGEERWGTVENFFSDKTFKDLKGTYLFPFEEVCNNLAGTGEFTLTNLSSTSQQKAHQQGILNMIALMGFRKGGLNSIYILKRLTNSWDLPISKASGVSDEQVKLHQAILAITFGMTIRTGEESPYHIELNQRLKTMKLPGYQGEKEIALLKERVKKKFGPQLKELMKKYNFSQEPTSIGMDIYNLNRSVEDIAAAQGTDPTSLTGTIIAVDPEGIWGRGKPPQPGRTTLVPGTTGPRAEGSQAILNWSQQAADYLEKHPFKSLRLSFWDGGPGHNYSFVIPLADLYRLSEQGSQDAITFLNNLKRMGETCKTNNAILSLQLSQGWNGTAEYAKTLPIEDAAQKVLTHFGKLDVRFYNTDSRGIIGKLEPIAAQIKILRTNLASTVPFFKIGVRTLDELHIIDYLTPQAINTSKFLEGLETVKNYISFLIKDLTPLAYLTRTPLRPERVKLSFNASEVTENDIQQQLAALKPLQNKFKRVEIHTWDRWVGDSLLYPTVEAFIKQFGNIAKEVKFTFHLLESKHAPSFQKTVREFTQKVKATVQFKDNKRYAQTFTVTYGS